MKIQPSIEVRSTDAASAAKSDRDAAGKPAQGTTPPEQATVRLTELAALLQSAGGGANVAFDDKKVEALKQAIAEGRFDVNTTIVAERLIENALALSRKGK